MTVRTNIYEDVRTKAVARIEAWRLLNYPNLKVVYENDPDVNLDEQTADWLDVSFRFSSGQQASLESRPIYRVRGWLDIGLYLKEGSGTIRAYKLMDNLREYFMFHQQSGLVTHAPYLHNPKNWSGWYFLEMSVGFVADSLV